MSRRAAVGTALAALTFAASGLAAPAQTSEQPGEPVTVHRGVSQVGPIVPLPGGELYMIGWGSSLLHIPPTGPIEWLLQGQFVNTVAPHPHGGLLYGTQTREIKRYDPSTGTSVLWALTPYQGSHVTRIALAPNGDVWVKASSPVYNTDLLIHHDAYGSEKRRYVGTSQRPLPDWLFFAPDGTPHGKINASTILRLEGDAFVPVFDGGDSMLVHSAVFDREGRIYMTTTRCQRPGSCSIPARGVVMLDSSYQLVHDPFALEGMESWGLAFLRDAAGAPSDRLMIVTADGMGNGFLVEANPAGVPAGGIEQEGSLVIETASFSPAMTGVPYTATLTAGPGVSWSVDEGWPLPAGLTLSAEGVLQGIPEMAGFFAVVVQASSGDRSGNRLLRLTVRDVTPAQAAVILLSGVDGESSAVIGDILDGRGNRNGVYDVGDLRALVRSN